MHFQEVLEQSPTPLTDEGIVEQKNLIEFFKFITPKTCPTAQKRLKAIQNRFILRHKYDLQINDVIDLAPYQNRLHLLSMALENVIKRSQETDNVCNYFVGEISDLASALDLSKMFVVKRLCQRTKCLIITCAITYNMLDIVDCNKENKNDFVELALELLAQQIQLTKSSQNSSTLAALLNDNDPLAFPLAYELLVRASVVETDQISELAELINYVRIATTGYSSGAISQFYENREKEISQLICEAIDASEITVGEITLNFSTNLNNSFDIKQEIKPKKRYSVSVFDDVAPLPTQASQTKVWWKNSNNIYPQLITFPNRFRSITVNIFTL